MQGAMPASSADNIEKSASPPAEGFTRMVAETGKPTTPQRVIPTSRPSPLSSMEVHPGNPHHSSVFPRVALSRHNSDRLTHGTTTAPNPLACAGSLSLPSEENKKSKCGDGEAGGDDDSKGVLSSRGYARRTVFPARRGAERKARKPIGTSSGDADISLTGHVEGAASQGTSILLQGDPSVRSILLRTTVDDEDRTPTELCTDEAGYDWPVPSVAVGMTVRSNGSRGTRSSSTAPRPSSFTSNQLSRSRQDLNSSPVALGPTDWPPHVTIAPCSRPNSSGAPFVPLGSPELTPEHGVSGEFQRSGNCSISEEDRLHSTRKRPTRHMMPAPASLSASGSVSSVCGGVVLPTQVHHSRNTGEFSASINASTNARSLRDARAALLRRVPPGMVTSSRSSHPHSFRRTHSNVSVSGTTSGEGVPLRATRSGIANREKRSSNCYCAVVMGAGGTRGVTDHQLGLEEDTVRTGAATSESCSPLRDAAALIVSVTAPLEGPGPRHSGRKGGPGNGGGQRHSNHNDDGPLLEMMETSDMASHGPYEMGGSAPGWPTGADVIATLRSHNAGAGGSIRSCERPGGDNHEERTSQQSGLQRYAFLPPRMPSGYGSLSRFAVFNDSDTDSIDDLHSEQRHRHRVDKVLRHLNGTIRSNGADEKGLAASTQSQHNSKNLASSLCRTSSAANAGLSQMESSSGWCGIGSGDGTSGLALFGTTPNTCAGANMSTTDHVGGGGWLGIGGNASSEDWYHHMRQLIKEEEPDKMMGSTATAAPSSNNDVGDVANTPSHSTAMCRLRLPAPTQPSSSRPNIQLSVGEDGSSIGEKERAPPGMRSSSLTSVDATRKEVLSSELEPYSPSTLRPTRPPTEPCPSPPRERFTRRYPLMDSTQPQSVPVSNTSAISESLLERPQEGNADRGGVASLDAAVCEATVYARFCAGTAAVGVHRVPFQDGGSPRTSCAEAATSDPCHRLSAVGTNEQSASISAGGSGGSTVLLTALPPLPQLSGEITSPISSPSSRLGSATPSHRQFDWHHHSPLPWVLPTVSAAVVKTSPLSKAAQSSKAGPVPVAARNITCLSHLPSTIAHLPTQAAAVTGRGAPAALADLRPSLLPLEDMHKDLPRRKSSATSHPRGALSARTRSTVSPPNSGIGDGRVAEKAVATTRAPPAIFASDRPSLT